MKILTQNRMITVGLTMGLIALAMRNEKTRKILTGEGEDSFWGNLFG